jgi:phage baseplate assembly protein W
MTNNSTSESAVGGREESDSSAVYGTGWAWPIQIDGTNLTLAKNSVEDIKKNLKLLFNTQPGERVMRPDFGCDLNQYMFENYSEGLISEIESTIRGSISRYEPRVLIDAIDIVVKTSIPITLDIHLNYHIVGSAELQAISGSIGGSDGRIAI